MDILVIENLTKQLGEKGYKVRNVFMDPNDNTSVVEQVVKRYKRVIDEEKSRLSPPKFIGFLGHATAWDLCLNPKEKPPAFKERLLYRFGWPLPESPNRL